MKECLFYTKLDNGAVRCMLCPHQCLVHEGKRGICGSRKNIGGTLFSLAYGHPCAIADDPIEKKPLLRFHPGTRCLSLACTGCNFRCLNCQNHDISQARPEDVPSEEAAPEDIVRTAEHYRLPGIAYTYTEPLTWFEYMLDIARLAHDHGLWNILVSAGYVNLEPLRMLIPYLDAANVDLKSFSDDIYRRVSGGQLQPVLQTLLALKQAGVWLEITNLLIPGVNDNMKMFSDMCRWLVDNGFSDTPLHISRFFPQYKMTDSYPTPIATMKEAQRIALDAGIRDVFLGNV